MGQQEKAGQINLFDEIIVDNFAGGGGASTGMELAAGKPVAIAINHDPDNPPAMRFCQWCGAPMTDEAVEMVMERMDELQNEIG